MGNTIKGVVRLNGAPVAADVTIVDVDTNVIVGTTRSNSATGAWLVTALAAGRYEAVIIRGGYRGYVEGPFELDGTSEGFSFQHWRIFITENCGDISYVSIQEIEMRDAIGGPDLTVVPNPMSNNPRMWFSSQANAENRPELAFDDQFGLSSKWTAEKPSLSQPQFVGYSFDSPVALQQIAIWGAASGQELMSPRDFQVHGSVDRTNFVVVKSFSGVTGWNAGVPKLFSLKSSYKHWRLLVKTIQSGTDAVIARLQFRKVAGVNQPAVGGTPGQSSFYDENTRGEKAFNNDGLGYPNIWASAPGLPQWVSYEFADEQETQEVLITARQDGFNMPVDFEVQGSDDGSTWSTDWAVSGSTGWTAGETRLFTKPL